VLHKSNTVTGNGYGIYAGPGSSGNTFRSNTASENPTGDCADISSGSGTAGTANTWMKNEGAVATPDLICS
jgi:parallel beta-helix repeat protein